MVGEKDLQSNLVVPAEVPCDRKPRPCELYWPPALSLARDCYQHGVVVAPSEFLLGEVGLYPTRTACVLGWEGVWVVLAACAAHGVPPLGSIEPS